MAASDDPKLSNDFYNTVSVVGARSTFLAGFTYYQIGRYGFTAFNDTAYIVFCTLSFALAVLTSGISLFFSYHLYSLQCPHQKLDFCERTRFYVRLTCRIYYVAAASYLLGLGRIGYVYYNPSPWRNCPFVIMLIAVPILVRAILYVASTGYALQINCPIYGNYIEIEKNSRHASRTGTSLEFFITKASSIVASRSIFIAGLAQNVMMRFMPYPNVFSVYSPWNSLVFFGTMATALALVSGIVLTVVEVFLPDCEDEKRLAFAIRLEPVVNFAYLGYMLAFVMLALAICVMGNGTACDRQIWPFYAIGSFMFAVIVYAIVIAVTIYKDIASRHDQKGRESRVTMFTAAEKVASDKLEEEVKRYLSRINTAGSMSTFAAGYLWYNIDTMQTDVFSQPWDQSLYSWTLAFLIANLVTILLGLCAAVVDSVLTLLAFSLATVEERAEFAANTRNMSKTLTYFYKASLVGWLTVFALCGFVKFSHFDYAPLSYAIAGVIGMFIGSQYLAYCFHQAKVFDGCVQGVRSSALDDNNHTDDCNDEVTRQGGSNMPTRGVETDSNSWQHTEQQVLAAKDRIKGMNGLAFSILFLGGFAYYAILYFGFQGRPCTDLYIHSMSISFVASILIMYWATDYNNKMNFCHSDDAVLNFARSTCFFYRLIVAMSYVSVLSLLIGFLCLGYMKTTFMDNAQQFENLICIGTIVALLLMIGGFFHIARIYSVLVVRRVDDNTQKYSSTMTKTATQVVNPMTKTATQTINPIIDPGTDSSTKEVLEKVLKSPLDFTLPRQSRSESPRLFDYRRMNKQLGAMATAGSFVAGNVCYELLFVEIRSTPFPDDWYEILSALAFSFGVVLVTLSATVLLRSNELDSETDRATFGERLQPMKFFLFGVAMLSKFSWLGACIFLGAVKYAPYKGRLWEPSFAICSFCTLLMAYCLYDIRRQCRAVVADAVRTNSGKNTAAIVAVDNGGEVGVDDRANAPAANIATPTNNVSFKDW